MHTIKFQFVEEFEKHKFVDQQRGELLCGINLHLNRARLNQKMERSLWMKNIRSLAESH